MERKTYFYTAIATIYLILIAVYCNLELVKRECDDDDFISTCISFCSTDERAVSDELIRETFEFNETFVFGIYDNYTIKRGKPDCLLTKTINSTKKLDDYDYDLSFETYYLQPYRYCNQLVEISGVKKWEMIVCDNDKTLQLIFHGFGKSFPHEINFP
jgi:hypothetical protein